jgi:hypothetical protein
VRKEPALVDTEGDSVQSGPGFDEIEFGLYGGVDAFGGFMVCKEGAFIHEQEVLGPYRDAVNEEMKQEDTEGRTLRKPVAYIGEWAEASLESDRKGAV